MMKRLIIYLVMFLLLAGPVLAQHTHDIVVHPLKYMEKIIEGDSSIEVVDTGDGYIIMTEDGVEYVRLSDGLLSLNAGLAVKYGATGAGFIQIYEDSDDGINKVTVAAVPMAADWTMKLPPDGGADGEALTVQADGSLDWETVGGTTAYDDIGDPDASGSITFGAHTGTYTSATDGWGGIIIDNTAADLTSNTTLLTLQVKDNNDAQQIFINCFDDSAGTPDSVFKVYDEGYIVADNGYFTADGGYCRDVNFVATGAVTATITASYANFGRDGICLEGSSNDGNEIFVNFPTFNPTDTSYESGVSFALLGFDQQNEGDLHLTSSVDGYTGLTIDSTIADVTSAAYLLTLQYKDNNDADADFIACYDDSAGTPDLVFDVDYYGTCTAFNGFIAGTTVKLGNTDAPATANRTKYSNTLIVSEGASSNTNELWIFHPVHTSRDYINPDQDTIIEIHPATSDTYEMASRIFDVFTDARLILPCGLTNPGGGSESDLSSGGHTATYNGSMAYNDKQLCEYGLIFRLDMDGSNDYISIPDHANFSYNGTNDEAVSWSFWIEVTNLSADAIVISKWDETNAAEDREWKIYLDSNEKVHCELYDETNNDYEGRITDAGISQAWHHIVVTYDGTAGANASTGITIYVDGAVEASSADVGEGGTYANMVAGSTPVWIGAQESTAGAAEEFIKGDLAFVSITQEELSAANVWKLYLIGRGCVGI